MYTELIGLYLYSSIFAMLFDVSIVMYNPFGPRAIDIEHFNVGSGIRKFAKQLQKADHPNTMTDHPEASFISLSNDVEEHAALRDHQMAMLVKVDRRRRSLFSSLLG